MDWEETSKQPWEYPQQSIIKNLKGKLQWIGTFIKRLLPLPSYKKQSSVEMNSAYTPKPHDSDFVSQTSTTQTNSALFTEAP